MTELRKHGQKRALWSEAVAKQKGISRLGVLSTVGSHCQQENGAFWFVLQLKTTAELGMVSQPFSPNIQGAEAGGTLNLRPA